MGKVVEGRIWGAGTSLPPAWLKTWLALLLGDERVGGGVQSSVVLRA